MPDTRPSTFPCRLVCSRRRRKLALQVLPNADVFVRAPWNAPRDAIERFVLDHADWIKRTVEQREKGRQPLLTDAELRDLASQAMAAARRLVETYAPRIGVSPRKVSVRSMRTRWGSCTRSGNVTFNTLIALMPEHVQTYLVVHELCHLVHFNHSPRFHELVRQFAPDCGLARKWLAASGAGLLSRLPS